MGEHSPLVEQSAAGARPAGSAKRFLVAAGGCCGVRSDFLVAQTMGRVRLAVRLGVSHHSTCAIAGLVCLRGSGGWRIGSAAELEKVAGSRFETVRTEIRADGLG